MKNTPNTISVRDKIYKSIIIIVFYIKIIIIMCVRKIKFVYKLIDGYGVMFLKRKKKPRYGFECSISFAELFKYKLKFDITAGIIKV